MFIFCPTFGVHLIFSKEKFGGRSSGCGITWDEALLGTVGETLERYSASFYNPNALVAANRLNVKGNTISCSEFALFHEKQYENPKFKILPFTDDIELYWTICNELTSGEKIYCPASFIYLPFTRDGKWITLTTSTGLAAHTDLNKATLVALFEIIERDSFVITWSQNIVPPKILVSEDIQKYIDNIFPAHYEWHFFDMTYDIKVPTILGFCVGEADFGKFIAVGSSTRFTVGEALKKVIKEIGQAVGYFRFLLGQKKNWTPSDDFNEILDFEQHSVFYTKRQDLWHVLDKWLNAEEKLVIDFNEPNNTSEKEQIKIILEGFKKHKYDVFFKDLTTVDTAQLGFYVVRLFCPQLIQLSGAYPFYFLGGKRLYEVPEKMGYTSYSFENLNHYPHPFP